MLYATMAATSRNTNLLDIYVSLLGIYMYACSKRYKKIALAEWVLVIKASRNKATSSYYCRVAQLAKL